MWYCAVMLRMYFLHVYSKRLVKRDEMLMIFILVGGQGIASGFRDAISLAWRLALLCRNKSSQPEFTNLVLEAWYEERKQQLEKSLASTIENGGFVCESNPLKIMLRDIYLWTIQLVPSWRHELQLGRRKEGMVQYHHSEGMPFLPELGGGLCLPQVYCRSVRKEATQIFFTDDVVFARGKKAFFQILVLADSIEDAISCRDAMTRIGELCNGEINPDEATTLIEDPTCETRENINYIFRVASGEEFANSSLCEKRPSPKYYDASIIGKYLKRRKFIILRPDRFVFAACNTLEELERAARNAVAYGQGGLERQDLDT